MLVKSRKIETQKKVQTQLGDISVKKGHNMTPLGNFRQSSYLQETALFLGQSEIFMDSSNLLSRLIRIDLSDKQIENLCHHYGEVL